ncbi:MAG: D-alanine--D-alanine ligase [Burkholderiaceae bacterium]|nr:D-alanine--D-alanine ligase [Burkholderiaceae bacterium]MCD8515856.1 D-alanine--D-alanine ligase [Burkholderiaceae bacterium]MCD8536949.1 D-alanine--D-alanine ligase [Burkholderiaceae bacterium]
MTGTMPALGKVGVLYGGRSAEREVSLMSGQAVYEALLAKGVNAHLFDTGQHGIGELAEQQFDRVFVALHGRYGEDGTIQGALELLGIPYTGSGHLASALAMDKIMTKRLWQQAGLPTPDYRVVLGEQDLLDLPEALGLPLILKAPNEGSTIGLSKVTDADGLVPAYRDVSPYDKVILAEKFITGRELTVAVLGAGAGAKALPIIEIIAPGGNYDYQSKYFSDETQYLCPASLAQALADQISEIAVRAYRALGCEGWARADIMLDVDMRPWLLEMNTSPGMTGHSLVPMAAKAAGMSFGELCVTILSQARCKVLNRQLAGQGQG